MNEEREGETERRTGLSSRSTEGSRGGTLDWRERLKVKDWLSHPGTGTTTTFPDICHQVSRLDFLITPCLFPQYLCLK